MKTKRSVPMRRCPFCKQQVEVGRTGSASAMWLADHTVLNNQCVGSGRHLEQKKGKK